MTTTMDILKRPFSVEPLTGIMLPDGIFDTAIFQQRITCYYTNVGATALNNVTIYLESIGATKARTNGISNGFGRKSVMPRRWQSSTQSGLL